MRILHDEDYRALRKSEYPPVGDQLDAIMKLAATLEGQIELPPEVTQWITRCQAVKTKYRKPETTA